MMPATEVMITAQTRISTKFRWMPDIVPASAEETHVMCALKKKSEPNHPTEYAPSA